MAKKVIKIFRVRNRFRQILGEFSEKEMLSRIRKGKVVGDEEILELPGGEWSKISAHDKFFSAILKRLAEENPEQIEPSKSVESQRPTSASENIVDKELGKTKHLGEEADIVLERSVQQEGSLIGGTLRKSDVDRLFERSAGNKSVGPGLGLEKALDELEPASKGEFEALAQPLNPAKLKTLSEKFRASGPRRRTLILASLLIVLLMFLFQSGQDGNNDQTNAANSDENAIGEAIPEGDRSESVAALVEEAKLFYSYDSLLDYRAAADISTEGLKLDPKNQNLLSIRSLSLARLYEDKESRNQVKEWFHSALTVGREQDPHHSGFYRAEAIVALFDERVGDAKNKIQEALEADPTNAENYAVLAELAIAKAEWTEAEASIDKSLKIEPANVRAQHLGAMIAAKRNNKDLARKYSGEVARINPLHADTYSIVGDIQSESGDLKNAKVLYELTTRLGRFASYRVLSHAHDKLAKFYEITGSVENRSRHELASSYYLERVQGRTPTTDSKVEAETFLHDRSYFEDRGRDLLKERKNSEALRFFQALRVLYPQDVRTMIRSGEVMERLAASYEDFRKVMLLYERASRIDRKNPEPLIRLAALEVDQFNFVRAHTLLEKAEEIAPENAEVKVAFGKYYFRRQDYVKARDYLSKASTINPTNADVYYYYGLLTRLYKPDLVKEAARQFYQAYILDANNTDALAAWLRLKVEDHEKNFAVKFIRTLLENDPQNAELHWVLGEVYFANKEARRSIVHYHKALDIDNRASKVRMSLARALASVGELPSAVEEYVLASRLDRRNPEGFFEAGLLLFEMKNVDFAEDVLKKLTSLTPNYPGAHRLLARVYQAKGKKDLSIAAMQKEVDNNPYNYKFAVEFAELFMSYEEYDKAIVELKRVTGLPPETKAPEFRVERVRAYLLLSRCLRAQSKSESAEGAIKTAIQIDPMDPELKRELGYVYHSLQRDREATEAFNFYLERNPAAQDASLIKALIKKMGTDE